MANKRGKMTSWHKTFCVVCGAALCLGLLLGAILAVAYHPQHYEAQYRALGISEELDITEEDLRQVTRVLIDYCRGARSDLDVEVTIHGVSQPFFTAREEAHMVDVAALFRLAGMLLPLLVLPGFLLLVFGAVSHRGVRLRPIQYVFYGMGITLLAIAGIAAFAAIDFNAFWTAFHQLFFQNNLWLLTPGTDHLIDLVPEAFFVATVRAILVVFLALLTLCGVLGIIGTARHRKGGEPHEKRI